MTVDESVRDPDPPPAAPAPRAIPLFVPSMPAFDRFRKRLEAVTGSGSYTNFGPVCREFETALATRLHVSVDRVTVVANATVGLIAALMAAAGTRGICAMPAWTHAASASAVLRAGLVPYFLDVDPLTWQLDPGTLDGRLRKCPGPVVAVLAVAPFGSRVDAAGWSDFHRRTGIPVVVDAAAGFDTWTDTPVTTVVSFHATKGFAIGEGGAVLSPGPDLGRRVRATTNLGMNADRVAVMPGINAKLDEFRAAIGQAALEIWPETRAALLDRVAAYDGAFAAAGLPATRPASLRRVATSTYVVELHDADAVATVGALERLGVQARRWWGDGCHRAPAFADCPREDLPATDALARRVVGLPLHNALSVDDIAHVVACVCSVARSFSA